MTLAGDAAHGADNNPLSDVEAQMRRALGLYGSMRPRVDNDPGEQPVRTTDRFGPQGGNQGLHRRRFGHDGEIPVTGVRRDAAPDAHAAPPTTEARAAGKEW